jgi:methionyl-tRNA formyltransferase
MVRALAALERGSLTFTPQPESGVTYAAKIATKLGNDETRIVWAKPAQQVHDHIRGLSPFPGAWFELAGEKQPVRVKVLRSTKAAGAGAPGTVLDDALTIACGDGAVRILELQREGKRAMAAAEFLRGNPLPQGTRLT